MQSLLKRTLSLLLALLLLVGALSLSGCKAQEAAPVLHGAGIDEVLEKEGDWYDNFTEFLRIDCDSPDAWQWELENQRIFAPGRYELGEAKEKYHLDMTYPVSTEGLDTLAASASAQFSEQQFRKLADQLREVAGDKQIIIVDLREESHYFLNGISISNFRLHNWGNLLVPRDQIQETEDAFFRELLGKTVTAYVEDDEVTQDEQLTLTVDRAMSEKELVESEGFTYFRLSITDHTFPSPDEIDAFIAFVQEVGTEDTWFHFHCHAGKGRTGVLLNLYDKMKNPQVPTQDILYRHAMTNSNYPLYLGDADSYKYPLYAQKAALTPPLMAYVEENHSTDYAVTFSQWLKDHPVT